MILALDTSGGELVACLLDDALQVRGARVVTGKRHQDAILDVVQGLLGGGSEVAGLRAIAVVRGPGSQTGLRVGLSTAEGMAFGGRVALLPLSSLVVAAHRAGVAGEVIAVVSAGRSNVFAQRADGARELVGPRVLCDVGQLAERIEGAPGVMVAGEPALLARAAAAGLRVASPLRAPEDALAESVRVGLNSGPLLAYHQLTGDYGES